MIVCVNPKAEDYEESLVIYVDLCYTVGFLQGKQLLGFEEWHSAHFVDLYRVNGYADELREEQVDQLLQTLFCIFSKS